MYDEIKALNKGDLHIHLNGLFDSKEILNIINEEFPLIPETFDINNDLNITTPRKNLLEYLKPWDVLRLIPKSEKNFKKLVISGFVKLKEDNIEFVELRSTIIYLTHLFGKNLQDTLSTVLSILNDVSIGYKIKYGLILTTSRGEFSQIHLTQLLEGYRDLGCPKEIIGLDLAGNEDYQVSSELPLLFRKAKEKYNLKITIHAGETGNSNNIIEAIQEYYADRIGHGTSILKSGTAIDLVVKNDICLEVCPISNYLTGSVIESNIQHPVLSFKENNIPFVICSDNPSIHAKSLTDDYFYLLTLGISKEAILDMYYTQKKYTFI